MAGQVSIPLNQTQAPFDFFVEQQAAIDRGRRYRGWEIAVKPFLDPQAGQRLLDRVLKKRNKPGESTEASITWGAASDSFDIVQDILPDISFQDHSENQDNNQDQQTPGKQILTYTEDSRTTETVRVENPDDANQWVEVERIKTITFMGEDKIRRKFILNWS